MIKNYKKEKKTLKEQINRINNNYSLVNINELKLQLENLKDAFWFGLITGAVGVLFITCYLTNKKTESDKA
ncbi:MAG: hypothetical protein I3273_07295 [Candidatus Moeniiplasma glomeromycotorum]|nr:hypothetical protein [Candidatus Moeniiplasma glomeromycotorum]MCE8168359.1 hypothetical protein [Candidatus Moeniiplasma glomeromycotorum]MCE8169891.1 hypothetical protein [Candidatus Moeniiplasma glomeromycotorum]